MRLKLVENSPLIERQVINNQGQALLDASGKPIEIPDEQEQSKEDKPKGKVPPPGNLLTKEQQAKFEEDPQSIVDMLNAGEVKGLETFPKWNPQVQTRVISSIAKKGTDLGRNPFLKYVRVIAETDVPIKRLTRDSLNVLEAAFDNKEIFPQNVNLKNNRYGWMSDSQAYTADDPDYKVKALVLLTSKKASKYGELDTIPIPDVVKSTKKKEIVQLLSNWQTKDGDPEDVKDAPGKDAEAPAAGEESGKESEKQTQLPKSDDPLMQRQKRQVLGKQASELVKEWKGQGARITGQEIEKLLRAAGLQKGESVAEKIGLIVIGKFRDANKKDSREQ